MQVGNILCLERGDFGHGVWVVPQLASAEANCSKLLRELCVKAHSACFVPLSTSRKKGLFLEVMCEMMSASRKRGLFLEVKPVNVTGLRSPGHSVQKMQNNRDFTLSRNLLKMASGRT